MVLRYGWLLAVGLLLGSAVGDDPVWATDAAAPAARASKAPVATLRPYPSVGFVVTCAFSHRSANDPILHPGHVGMSHRHDFFGNAATTATSTLATLREGKTTCNDPADRASYWIPSMVGSIWSPSMRAYYSAGALPPQAITTYPEGLQLIAGNPNAVRPNAGRAVAFSCGRGVNEPGWSAVPGDCDGPTSVRVTFPQCWDGKVLAAPGNSRYPVGATCPKGFPVALPLLRIVVATNDRTSPASFALSVGSISRMHADFWNAWDPKVLQELIAICIRGERESNRDVKRCRLVGTGPASVGPSTKETNF